MTKQKILAAIVAASLSIVTLGSMTAYAASANNSSDTQRNTALPPITTLPYEVKSSMQVLDETIKNSATAQQKALILEFAKKQGLDLSGYTFEVLGSDPIQAEKRADFVAASEKVGLKGNTARSASILSVVTSNSITGYPIPYFKQYLFSVSANRLDGAAIRMAPTNGHTMDMDHAVLVAFHNKDMQATALRDIIKAYDKNMAKAPAPVAALDFPVGMRASEDIEKALQSYFSDNGWRASEWKFYKNMPELANALNITEGYRNYLNDAEVGKAMAASANGGPQVMMMMPPSDFYFAERTFKIAGTSRRFYVDYCAFGINPEHEDAKPTFSWLIVKPAKANMNGKLDRFFYPVDTKITDIAKDMNAYFSREASFPPPARSTN